MGGLCSKASKDNDHFVGTGRTVGSTPADNQNQRATVPARIGTGSKIGGSDGSQQQDPREAARKAAQERADKSQAPPQGKLGQKLAEQKKQTRTSTLEQASREERGARSADENAEARQWN